MTLTPTPYEPPEGMILTTLGEVRRIGHGQIADIQRNTTWWDFDYHHDWRDDIVVWWRHTPERTVTIELPESVARRLSVGHPNLWDNKTLYAVRDTAREAIAKLDAEAEE